MGSDEANCISKLVDGLSEGVDKRIPLSDYLGLRLVRESSDSPLKIQAFEGSGEALNLNITSLGDCNEFRWLHRVLERSNVDSGNNELEFVHYASHRNPEVFGQMDLEIDVQSALQGQEVDATYANGLNEHRETIFGWRVLESVFAERAKEALAYKAAIDVGMLTDNSRAALEMLYDQHDANCQRTGFGTLSDDMKAFSDPQGQIPDTLFQRFVLEKYGPMLSATEHFFSKASYAAMAARRKEELQLGIVLTMGLASERDVGPILPIEYAAAVDQVLDLANARYEK